MNENNFRDPIFLKQIPITKNILFITLSVFALTWSAALFLWWQTGIDKSILFVLNNSNFDGSFVRLNKFITDYGMALAVFIYLLYIIASFKMDELKKKRQIFALILFSFAFAGIAGELLKEVFQRTRPIYEFPGQLTFLADSRNPSFPSGHATKAVALVLPFLFYADYKGRIHFYVKIFLSLISVWICFSRIILGAHYLSDVLAGFGLAFLFLPIAVLISNRVLAKTTAKQLEAFPLNWIIIFTALMVVLILI